MKDLDIDIIDAILEKPYGFTIKGKRFSIEPTTLGVMLYTQPYISSLGVDWERLKQNPVKEFYGYVRENKDVCCRIIAAHTCKSKDELFSLKLEEKIEFFKKNVNEEDLVALLMAILSSDKTDELMKKLGIDKENDRMNRITKVKQSKNTIAFNGKSIYGTLIASLVEYGWTLDYILWGISYTNIRLIMADKIASVYLTDDEMKKVPKNLLSSGDIIRGDDPANMQRIREMDWR